MLKDISKHYYLELGHNCAEAVFLAASQQYKVACPLEAYKAISCFGGGASYGSLCGAAAGACAFLGVKYGPEAGQSASATNLSALCKQFMTAFSAACDSDLCRDIMPKFKTPECRCFKTVEIASDILEDMLK